MVQSVLAVACVCVVRICEEVSISFYSYNIMVDTYVTEVLHDWGLGNYVQNFRDYDSVDTDLLEKNDSEILVAVGPNEEPIEGETGVDVLFVPTPIKGETGVEELISPTSSAPKLFPLGLAGFLQRNNDGRLILAHKSNLENDTRQKLVTLIINEYMKDDDHTSIPGRSFEYLTSEIIKLFPNERKETYYIPYCPKTSTSKKIPARGKLWSKYVNTKRMIKTYNAEEDKVVEVASQDIDLEDSENQTALQFLENSVEPFDKINEFWSNTYQIRTNQTSTISITAYFQQYPALKLQDGHKLIEADFNRAYSDKESILYMEWPKIEKAIISLAKYRKLKLLEELGNIADTTFAALIILPYLFTSTTVYNEKTRKRWRPSKLEVQESFMLHLTVIK